MAGLMDAIQKNMESPQTLAQQSVSGAQVSDILRTKLTGKATQPGAGPTQSALGEALAKQQGDLGAKQVAQQGAIQAGQQREQAADITQQSQQAAVQSQQNREAISQDYANKFNSIMDDIEANKSSMDTSRRLAQMEQAGFLARATNDNYIQELKRQGDMNRLTDANSFKEAAIRDALDDQEDLFEDDIKFQKMMNASDRDFQKALSSMSNDFAIKLADNAIRSEGQRTMIQGFGSLVGSGIQAYDTYNKPKVAEEGR